MKDQLLNDVASVQTEQIIKQLINSWNGQNKAVTIFINKYTDDVYLNEVAPSRNRAIYLFGHLIATSDGLLPLLGLGERLYPQLESIFLTSPDKTVAHIPKLAELKQHWEAINVALNDHFSKMLVIHLWVKL